VELLPLEKKEGEATVNPPAQSPCTLCPERGPKIQLADTPLLKRRSQGGRTSQGFTLVYWNPQEHRHTPTGKEPKGKGWMDGGGGGGWNGMECSDELALNSLVIILVIIHIGPSLVRFPFLALTLPFSFTYGQGGNCAFGTRVSLLISVICFIFHLSNLYYIVFVCIS
jgi:hypothetical protein